jgi:CRP-like cAMP-binding protein
MSPDELKRRFPTLTKHFSQADREALLGALTPRRRTRGERLTIFGERGDTMHLIAAGQVSIHVEQDGEDLLLGQATPGCVVGEIGLVDPGPSSATLTALEDVETLDLDHEGFERLCAEHPATASALLRAISLELVHRLRGSSHEILKRVDDHHWMRVRARQDRRGWLARMARLVGAGAGGEA